MVDDGTCKPDPIEDAKLAQSCAATAIGNITGMVGRQPLGLLLMIREAVSAKIEKAELDLIRHKEHQRGRDELHVTGYLRFYREVHAICEALVSLHRFGNFRDRPDVAGFLRKLADELDGKK